MNRIEDRLREVEHMLVHLATNSDIRERLMPVLLAHLETVNLWRIMKLSGFKKQGES